MLGTIFRGRILKQKQLELDKQKQLELEKQKQEKQQQLEIEKQQQEKQKQLDLEKQKQLEIEKQKQLDLEKQKQLDLEKQKQLELEKQQQLELQKQRLRELELEKQKQIEIEKQKQKQLHIVVNEIEDKESQEYDVDLLSLSNNLKQDSNNVELTEMLNLFNSINTLGGNIGSNNYMGLNNIINSHILTNFIGSNSKDVSNIVGNYINNNFDVYKIIYKTFKSNKIIYDNFDEISINKGGKLIISNHINLSDTILILNKIKMSTVIIGGIELIHKIFGFLKLKNTMIEDIFLQAFNIIIYNPDKNGNGNGEGIKRKMLETINNKKNVLLFPEAIYGRSQNKILPFKLGGLKLAYDNKLPIVPIVLYYSNKNHIYNKPLICSANDIITESLAIYKDTGDIIVHQCNNVKDVLPLPNESFEQFHKRIHNIMQAELTELHKKYNKK
jgi:1-acyl-sn-glycerol-3-phosphate acyltransferase